jgi:hypothetical protein
MLQRIQDVTVDIVKSDVFRAILLWIQVFRDVRLCCWVRFSWCCKGTATFCSLEILENPNTDSVNSWMIWILKVDVVYSREIKSVFHTSITSEQRYSIVWLKVSCQFNSIWLFSCFLYLLCFRHSSMSNDDMYKWFLHLVCMLCPCWWPSKGWNMVDIIIVS